MEERIIELEIKLSYQEDLVQELNRIVTQQQFRIDRLQSTCELLHEKIKSLQDFAPPVPESEQLPPHY